ncbi:hypothetical protein ACLESD_33880 [Pyxidicoccus sp. 3LFB2]
MKNGILGALLVSLLTACGGGLEAEAGAGPEEALPEQAPEAGEVTAAACSPYYYEFIYYSDCTRTQQVGWETLNCRGVRYLHGTKTRYYDAEIADLCPACGTFPYHGTCN